MKSKPFKDPRGHSLRIYSDVYDSAAYAALSPHDVLAYLALLRELKGYNNGDLSLPLSRAKKCGVSHPKTLARSLRALCAVGLVAVTRKGGCTKGGQRLPTLYRMTDRECYEIPAKYLEAMKETHEWKRVTSVQHGLDLIAAAEAAVKKSPEKLKSPGHAVSLTMAPGEPVKAKTRAPCEPWSKGTGHGMNMAKNPESPDSMRVVGHFSPAPEMARHRAPHSTPLHVAIPATAAACTDGHGRFHRLIARPAHLFTGLLNRQHVTTH